jgi:DHA1 family multidrug resistance protein-like MFS transporter
MSTPQDGTGDTHAATSWRRNVAVVCVAELVAIAGFGVANPFLPLFIQELGIEGERAVRIWSGLIFSTHAIAMAVCAPIWGALSDRYGRKVMVERSMFGGAVVIALIGWVRTMGQFMLLRTVWGALTGTITAATTLVATNTPRKRVGFALGMLQMAIYVGSSLGPLLGGTVADTLGFRAAFWVTGSLLFLAGLGVLFFVREDRTSLVMPPTLDRAGCMEPVTLRDRLLRHVAPVLGTSGLLVLIGIRLLARTGFRMMAPVLPLFVQSITPAGARVASITGLITGVSGATGAAGALGLGRLGDRIGYRAVMIGCAGASALLHVAQFFASGTIALLVLRASTGLTMGGMLAALSASLALVSPAGKEGTVYGIQSAALALANGGGPVLGSIMMAWIGLRWPFLAAAIIFAVAAVAALRLSPSRPSG